MGWDAAAIDAAFTDWLWVPDGTEVHELPGGRLLVRPPYLSHRAFAVGTPPPGAEEQALEEALEVVARHDLPQLHWALAEQPENEAFADLLGARGATPFEALDRLIWEPTDLPDARSDAVVLPVLDVVAARALGRIDEVVFEDLPIDDERLSEVVSECAAEYSSRRGARFVAWLDGEGVSNGGLTMAGEVARLWGGATLPHARRRGVYAAVLAERLRVALDWGATLALVKGRIETSAPILRRFGFRPHGREVTWEVRRRG